MTRISIAHPVTVTGVGLHTGAATTVHCHPAPAETGIVFRRTDLPGTPTIPATLENVVATDRRTVIGRGGVTVQTIEHFLAAVRGHGIDDLHIDIDGPEPPMLDGSAAAFSAAFREAGLSAVGGPVTRLRLSSATVQDGSALYVVEPGEGCTLSVEIEWRHPLIRRQAISFTLDPPTFARELAGARTFGFQRDIATLRRRGLLKGARPACALLLSDTGLVHGRLRWPDEFARHKMLDVIGDLALLNGRWEGRIVATYPSHRGNMALARRIRCTASVGE